MTGPKHITVLVTSTTNASALISLVFTNKGVTPILQEKTRLVNITLYSSIISLISHLVQCQWFVRVSFVLVLIGVVWVMFILFLHNYLSICLDQAANFNPHPLTGLPDVTKTTHKNMPCLLIMQKGCIKYLLHYQIPKCGVDPPLHMFCCVVFM